MKNWAGNIQWNPSEIAKPDSEAAIQALVLRAANEGKQVRMIGTGHSFTPVCQTTHITLSLDNYQGLIHVDKETCQATVKAGTKLRALGELLFQEGLAMENLGDIDVQSIAGTISTGTHGTGASFGTISTQVIALRFINGKGEIVDCSRDEQPELFRAAQVSLGSLGVITQVTLQCVPAYKLMMEMVGEIVDDVLGNLSERLETNRNFEFFWLPHTDTAITKTTNIVDTSAVDKANFFNFWSEYVLENLAFKITCELSHRFPQRSPGISRFIAGMVSNVRKVQYSHKIYATQRLVRFKEMEYNVPAEAYQDVWKELTSAMKKHNFPVIFPIENRWVKGDDILLSPAYGRDSAYLACHVFRKKNHQAYFDTLEAIFRAYGGRPHWGKMNTLRAKEVAESYPELSTFLKHREAHDPDGLFVSPYIAKLLGIQVQTSTLVA
ncbi:MAG: D-arabinono-1,4-lactone oxidase [Bacteroidota bacterium]